MLGENSARRPSSRSSRRAALTRFSGSPQREASSEAEKCGANSGTPLPAFFSVQMIGRTANADLEEGQADPDRPEGQEPLGEGPPEKAEGEGRNRDSSPHRALRAEFPPVELVTACPTP